ncbi:alpha/beta fold hydrolase [Sphingomonas sp. SUN039]|uniref:alpha/beta fold hydrolase n=1 Tax=Sphingomonas sp. SUN039 TaxID=2937787 RepID=UPI0021645304|nr:alpha/beta hydrolase [Sphingomonas sp. SUN039]UVO54274.1 alpha/beta fold hydrolase [Sphingomonas sp. SUN039]
MTGRPAFALLHGGGQGSWVWDDVVALLRADGARVLALDVPGCGVKRGRDVATLDADAVATELVEDMRAADLSDAILVGHSLAGAILPRVAAIAPELIRRLVYITCTAPAPGISFRGQMGTGLQGSNPDEVGWPVDPATHSADARYRLMFCNDMDPDFATDFLAQMGKDDWPMDVLTRSDHRYDHLAATPSTYIVCERDNGLRPTWQRRFAERLHCARIVSLDSGHQAMTTQPERLAEMLLAEATLPI